MSLDRYFAAEEEKLSRIAKAGGWQTFVDALPEKKKLIGSGSGRVLCCCDERLKLEGRVACAEGALLISEWGDALRFVEQSGITSIVSHAGCTAAGILWRRVSPQIEPRPGELDEFCDRETARLAERLRVHYDGQTAYGEQEGGKADEHMARVIYYVGVEDFNPRVAFADLPIGAVVTRRLREPINALADLGLAMSIAFGQNGYGDRLTAEHPLVVVTVGGRWDDTAEELKQEVSRLVNRQQGKVITEKLLI